MHPKGLNSNACTHCCGQWQQKADKNRVSVHAWSLGNSIKQVPDRHPHSSYNECPSVGLGQVMGKLGMIVSNGLGDNDTFLSGSWSLTRDSIGASSSTNSSISLSLLTIIPCPSDVVVEDAKQTIFINNMGRPDSGRLTALPLAALIKAFRTPCGSIIFSQERYIFWPRDTCL